MSNENYVPYGEEWVKEISKLPKKFIIENLLRPALIKDAKEPEPIKKSGYKENWNPDWKGDPNDELRWKGW